MRAILASAVSTGYLLRRGREPASDFPRCSEHCCVAIGTIGDLAVLADAESCDAFCAIGILPKALKLLSVGRQLQPQALVASTDIAVAALEIIALGDALDLAERGVIKTR